MPDQSKEFDFSFNPKSPGVYRSIRELSTVPKLNVPLERLVLKGVAVVDDFDHGNRLAFAKEMDQKIRDRVVAYEVDRIVSELMPTAAVPEDAASSNKAGAEEHAAGETADGGDLARDQSLFASANFCAEEQGGRYYFYDKVSHVKHAAILRGRSNGSFCYVLMLVTSLTDSNLI